MFQRAQHAAPLRNSVAARHDRLRRVTCCAARQKIKRALRLLRVNLRDACAGGQALGKQRNEKAAKAPGLKTRSFVRVNLDYMDPIPLEAIEEKVSGDAPGLKCQTCSRPFMSTVTTPQSGKRPRSEDPFLRQGKSAVRKATSYSNAKRKMPG